MNRQFSIYGFRRQILILVQAISALLGSVPVSLAVGAVSALATGNSACAKHLTL